MTQQELFQSKRLPPASHRCDPITSHVAEAKHAKKRVTNCDIVLAALRTHPRTTAYELARYVELSPLEVARRLSDLKRTGDAVQCAKRHCNVKHSLCCTWEAWR